MASPIIDGRAVAGRLRAEAKEWVARLEREHGVRPGLAVVLVGEDPASQVYVASKLRQSAEVGIRSMEHRLPAATAEADVVDLVRRLGADPEVDGILVQMPLPGGIDPGRVILALPPEKDVDGLHPENAGRLVLGRPGLVPCTPQGALLLVKEHRGPDLSGLEAVVIGRSILVGKPVALLLQGENCTVTMAHSRTRDLPAHCRRADVLIAGAGRAGLVRGDWIKPGATVIDVGITRTEAPGGGSRLAGDVAFDEAARVAGAITPVPGGVGPMTVACLLRNTILAAFARRGLPAPSLGA